MNVANGAEYQCEQARHRDERKREHARRGAAYPAHQRTRRNAETYSYRSTADSTEFETGVHDHPFHGVEHAERQVCVSASEQAHHE